MVRYDQFEEILTTKQILVEVVENIFNRLGCFVEDYDRKVITSQLTHSSDLFELCQVFVIGLSSILTQKDMASLFTNKMAMVLISLAAMLRIEIALDLEEYVDYNGDNEDQDEFEMKPYVERIVFYYLKGFKM